MYLFPLQSLESHVTKKKAHSSQHQSSGPYIATWCFALGLSEQDLLTIWILRIQRTCLDSLLTLLLHFGKRITSTFQQQFSWVFTQNRKTTLKFCTHRFRSVPPFFPPSPPFKLLLDPANPQVFSTRLTSVIARLTSGGQGSCSYSGMMNRKC